MSIRRASEEHLRSIHGESDEHPTSIDEYRIGSLHTRVRTKCSRVRPLYRNMLPGRYCYSIIPALFYMRFWNKQITYRGFLVPAVNYTTHQSTLIQLTYYNESEVWKRTILGDLAISGRYINPFANLRFSKSTFLGILQPRFGKEASQRAGSRV